MSDEVKRDGGIRHGMACEQDDGDLLGLVLLATKSEATILALPSGVACAFLVA